MDAIFVGNHGRKEKQDMILGGRCGLRLRGRSSGPRRTTWRNSRVKREDKHPPCRTPIFWDILRTHYSLLSMRAFQQGLPARVLVMEQDNHLCPSWTSEDLWTAPRGPLPEPLAQNILVQMMDDEIPKKAQQWHLSVMKGRGNLSFKHTVKITTIIMYYLPRTSLNIFYEEQISSSQQPFLWGSNCYQSILQVGKLR